MTVDEYKIDLYQSIEIRSYDIKFNKMTETIINKQNKIYILKAIILAT